MSSFAFASVVLVGSFAAALVGMVLHVRPPDRHLNANSREVVTLVMALVASMSALVLSLLMASASASYYEESNELKTLSVNIIQLDRTLESYGPGAKVARDRVRDVVRQTHDRIWSPEGVRPEDLDSVETRNAARADIERLRRLSPTTNMGRTTQSQAIQEAESLTQARPLIFEQLGNSVSWPFLTVLVLRICLPFLGFGLFSSPNATVTMALLAGAVSNALTRRRNGTASWSCRQARSRPPKQSLPMRMLTEMSMRRVRSFGFAAAMVGLLMGASISGVQA